MTERSPAPEGSGRCPACAGASIASVYSVDDVPAHSVLLMRSRAEAVDYPKGRIDLHHCAACGFVFNAAFDATLQEYSDRYEETQSFSQTFRDFHRRLAEELVSRWDIRGKDVLEIGCGKGDFLGLLCELGGNRGVGFDPAYVPGRGPESDDVQLRFYRETYPPKSTPATSVPTPDFVCCKMTLEHIPDVRAFVMDVRQSLPAGTGTPVFFQVPDAERILREATFWDVYYEHCSYFTRASLARLFEACGFTVAETWTDFDGQYLMLMATSALSTVRHAARCDPESGAFGFGNAPGLGEVLESFADRTAADVSSWKARLRRERENGGTACLWGAGSKAVAFLSALQGAPLSFAVDVNPHKQGTYLPGSGLEIVGPSELGRLSPTLVVAMNSTYLGEIAAELQSMGVAAELVGLG